MRFRTEIESIKACFELGHADKMVLLGSCFTDEVGSRLAADGLSGRCITLCRYAGV